MSELWQKSRCDDGSMMIHTEGYVMAFVDTNKGAPEDEAVADRIVTAVNAYDNQRALIETLVSALKAAQAATEYMGDKLNGMDAVSKEDVEATFDGFNLPRLALEAARQEGFQ